jgi:hypothetical protein
MANVGIWKEIWTIKGDTSFMEQVINNKSAFISREYRDSQNRKHSQIVAPEKSAVENIYMYNERNDLIEIVRIEDDKSETTMKVKYKYDINDRVVDIETYFGEGDTLGSKEITIYE